jgi:UDP-N-acetylmuramate--alanine ligase
VRGRIQQVHFVGVGGAGMSGIAEVLVNQGFRVSGSDLKPTQVTERLASLGARVFAGHAAANVHGAHVVVTSSAVRADNPEVLEARRLHIPVIPRAEMLAELMRTKYSVAVSGSHGKTTTTSMIALVLERGGLDPTLVVGGRLGALGSGARLGRSDFMVVEADESDRSFLKLQPTLAVVTNVDREHLDVYRDLADAQDAFVEFANRVPFWGAAIVCADDAPARALLPRVARRSLLYGLAGGAQVEAREVQLSGRSSRYVAVAEGRSLGELSLRVPGRHNVLNSLAAVAVGLELELGFPAIRDGLESFRGVDRRFETKGEAGGVTVIDDYGHHPTEIRATLEALLAFAEGRRTVVLFQPHRYTRTRALWDEFTRAFDGVDVLLLSDVYAASEDAIAGVTSERLAQAIAAQGRRAEYAGDVRAAAARLLEVVESGDVVLTLGAGNVHAAGEELLRRLGAGA